ncbi:WxL domain-containing protein [Enterococcus innesii]|uniref:WxL domain-containing protein n=1 Tax=Enterococcus innesii TaxID=2839759 RepID=UPI003B58EF76
MPKKQKIGTFLSVSCLAISTIMSPVAVAYADITSSAEAIEETANDATEISSHFLYPGVGEEVEPRFFFTRSQMQGSVEDPIQVTFFSDQEVLEARVSLPEEATLLKEQLPTGVSVEEGEQPREWVVQSKRAQHTFVLPLVFDKVGSYELSVEETTAYVEIREQEETHEEVSTEDTESSDEDLADQEDSKEDDASGEDQEQENEGREPVAEAPQEQQTEEEETNDEEELTESTVFDGETAEVTTMAQFRAAVANPDVGIISVQANLTESTANRVGVNRPLLIQGNGHTLNFGIDGAFFQLDEVTQASTFRIENATLTKAGTTPLIHAISVAASKDWTVELEDITEVNTNNMRLASLPEGSVHFTGGVSNFTRTTSTTTFIEAKEVLATNQAEVTISRGNAMVFFSSATVADPKITVEQGATVTITTSSGTANTINLRGVRPEIDLHSSGELRITTTGTNTEPTNTSNNGIALTGTTPKITMTSGAQMTVTSTAAKRGILLSGDDAQLLVSDSELSVTSASQAAIRINGHHPSFSSENSTIQLYSTSGGTTSLDGASPQLIFDSSRVTITSSTGTRITLNGANPVLNLRNSQLDMSATTGQGISLEGATPQVLMYDSQLLITDTGDSQGIRLQGTDALLSLNNQSTLAITGGGTGELENIQIGGNNARPELSITGESNLSVTTTSGTTAASNTVNNVIHLQGDEPKLNIQDAALDINVVSGARRGLFVNGLSADISFVDSNIKVNTRNDARAIDSLEANTGSAVIRNSKITIPTGLLFLMTGETLEIDNSEIDSARLFHHAFNVEIKNNSFVNLHHDGIRSVTGPGGWISPIIPTEGVMGSNRAEQTVSITTGAVVSIRRSDGAGPSASGFRMALGNSTVAVEQGGKFFIDNLGNGTPNDSQSGAPNAGVSFRNGDNNRFIVRDPGSEISIVARNGAAITNSWGDSKFSMGIEVSNGGYFSAVGNTSTTASGTFNVSTLNVNFDNPLFLDFRNLQSSGGVIFATDNQSKLTALNSDLALWQRLSDLDSDPTFNFRSLDYSFSGSNLSTLVSTSNPEELNTNVIGTSGLYQFSRLSSNNGRWAIADELRVPTNADKKIHGRISLPVGLEDSRPAWDDEAIVTVEVESPSGESTQEYTAKTVGHTDGSSGISIYGEEPRGGLFEIELDEPLEAGSKVRISKVELASGERTDGFEHQILTDTVEVFPIIPPTPAQFSSSIIAQNSATIQGKTDNVDAEVTATHNGEPLNTEKVMVEPDGRFTLDLSAVSLEMDDEIQVFLRDTEGSAEDAGVINPPKTNNQRGNINPAEPLLYRDAEFEPATILTVSDLGPVSPVDPMNPDSEVSPENPPVLPEEQGLISIDFVSQFDFGEVPIKADGGVYGALPQQLLNEDGTVSDEERPNYVQVSDRRPINDGWELTAKLSEEGFRSTTGEPLRGARILLENTEMATTSTNTSVEPFYQSTAILGPGNLCSLAVARNSEGGGTWIQRYGNQDTAGSSVKLDVPAGANPKADKYEATIEWQLSFTPGNE